MNEKTTKIRKWEVILFACVLIAALGIWGIVTYLDGKKDYGSVEVSVNGQEFGVYSLGKDQTIDIDGHNTLEIKDGKARMVHANCPDQLCTYMEAIDEKGGFIACLPNGVLVIGQPAQSAVDDGTALDGAAY